MRDLEDLFSSPRNFAGIAAPLSDLETARAVVLPVPWDATAEWHAGSRNGPRAIIDASDYLEFYDIELDREIQNIGIYTMPFLQPDYSSPKKTIDRIYQTSKYLLDKSKFLLSLGGEHTLSLGVVKAYLEKYKDLSVLQLDAHADLRDEYNGTGYCQATVMRRVYELCPLVQVGIRSYSLEEKKFMDDNNICIVTPEILNNAGALEKAISDLSDHVYVTLDVDVLDPSIMSAVGMPEPGGMSWDELLKILRKTGDLKNVVGADVVELSPDEGPAGCTYLAAKLAYKMIGYFNK
jgi:agmatinase